MSTNWNPEDLAKIPATPAEVVELLRMHIDYVSMAFSLTPRRSWPPTLMVKIRETPHSVGGDEVRVFVLDVPFNADDEKRKVLESVGRRLFAEKIIPVAVAFSSEAWFANLLEGDSRRPADVPDREEVIVVMATGMMGKNAGVATLKITRSQEESIQPGEWTEPTTTDVRSPLLNHFWRGWSEVVMRKCEPRGG